MKPLVTIIVPMYNEDKNIENCVNILNAQTNTNFEVCFIDDGSTDNTVKHLKNILEFKSKFIFRIITQENQGAAQARKTGIDKAITEFIMMLDCDDSISKDYVKKFYEALNKYNDADVIIPNMKMQKSDGEWIFFNFFSDDEVLEPYECLMHTMGGWQIHGIMAIKKSIINQSYNDYLLENPLNQNFINNDEVITRLNFKNASKIIHIDAVYFYNFNPLSTTKKINPKKYLTINNALIMKSLFSYDKQLHKKSISELISVLWGTQRYMRKNKDKLDNVNEWTNEIKKGISSIKYTEMIHSTSLKDKVKLGLSIISI